MTEEINPITDTSLISQKVQEKKKVTDVESLASTLKALNEKMDGLKDRKTLVIEEENQTIRKDEEMISIEDKFNSSLKDLAKEIREVNKVVNGNLPDANVAVNLSSKVTNEKLVRNKR